MSIYNRYYFTKELYPEYVVLIVKKKKLVSYSKDKKILNYIGFKGKLSLLKKKKINYLVLDDLDIIDIYSDNVNNYNKYLYLTDIYQLFEEIKVIMSLKYDLL